MIQLTKSSRVAFEALGGNDRKEFMGLYRHEDDPEALLDSYKAVRLPDTDNTYMLKFSDQLRAIAEISDGDLVILEVVKRDTLRRIFSSSEEREASL